MPLRASREWGRHLRDATLKPLNLWSAAGYCLEEAAPNAKSCLLLPRLARTGEKKDTDPGLFQPGLCAWRYKPSEGRFAEGAGVSRRFGRMLHQVGDQNKLEAEARASLGFLDACMNCLRDRRGRSRARIPNACERGFHWLNESTLVARRNALRVLEKRIGVRARIAEIGDGVEDRLIGAVLLA